MKISRKDFIIRFWWITFLPYVLLLILMEKKHSFVSRKKVITIQGIFSQAITFKEEVICIKSEKGLKVFSSKCTHLGCKIDKVHNGKLVCPCHGSAFDLKGNVLNGPAAKNLTELTYTIDHDLNEIIIKL